MAFNVIKGAYPSLVQHSVTKNVAAAEVNPISRGTLLAATANDEWEVADAADATAVPARVLYFALQSDSDLSAVMAGGGPTQNADAAVSALCVSPSCEVEVDNVDEGAAPAAPGVQLTAGAAGVLATTVTGGDHLYGVCTSAAFTKWANEAEAVAGWRTGAEITVVRLVSMFHPAGAVLVP